MTKVGLAEPLIHNRVAVGSKRIARLGILTVNVVNIFE
jgi:hypothetical protein